MSNELQGIWTQYGKERDAAARAGGDKLNITHAAVGSGLGAVPVVSPSQTALKEEVWRGPVNGVQINPKDPTDVIVDVVLPNDIGGFWIREWGLFDDAGKLVALGPHSEMHKPVITSGQAAEMLERFHLPVKDTGAVNLTIASQALATQNYVKSKVIEHAADANAHGYKVPKLKTYTKAGVYTFEAEEDADHEVWVIGAGGGSGGIRITVSQAANGAGHRFSAGGAAAGGGAYKIIRLKKGDRVQLAIGEGGAAGSGGASSVAATDGGTGGTSSFGDVLSATGGKGSVAVDVTALESGIYCGNATWRGGQGFGGDINVTGNPGLSPHPYRRFELVTRNPGGAGPFFGGPGIDWGTGEHSLGTGAAGLYVQGQNTPGYTAGGRGGDGAIIVRWHGRKED